MDPEFAMAIRISLEEQKQVEDRKKADEKKNNSENKDGEQERSKIEIEEKPEE